MVNTGFVEAAEEERQSFVAPRPQAVVHGQMAAPRDWEYTERLAELGSVLAAHNSLLNHLTKRQRYHALVAEFFAEVLRERAVARGLDRMEPSAVLLPWPRALGDGIRHSIGYDRADGYG